MLTTYRIITLGCKIARADAATLEQKLCELGLTKAHPDTPASLCCVVGCAVTGVAEGKSRRTLRRVKRENAGAVLVAVGCITKMTDTCKSAGVDILVEPGELDSLPELLGLTPTTDSKVDGFGSRTRAFLKVQDGCKGACSYCIVHKLRGTPRSITINEAVQKARELIAFGHTELVVSGVRLGTYEHGLANLIAELARLKSSGLKRLRLSSIEPMDFDFDIIRLIKDNDVIANSLHLPLQSGSDKILELMRRPYSTKDYAELIKKIRAEIPTVSIMTDIIAGFPEETDPDHKATVEFAREIGFARTHVFPFSPRAGTPAATLENQVDPSISKARARELIELSETSAREFRKQFIGETKSVIAQPAKDGMCGYTSEYIRVEFVDSPAIKGELVNLNITGENTSGLVGNIIKDTN